MGQTADEKPAVILYLEDSLADRELVGELLEAEGLSSRLILVGSRLEFEQALNEGGFDVVLSDYSLPEFDGMSALLLTRQRHPETPFIFLSGVMGEERAIETLKSGATDYVLKQRIERLVPSLRRALGEVRERARRRDAQRKLRASEEQLRQITDNVSDLIVQLDRQGRRQYGSPSYRRLLDETADRPGADFFAEVHPQDRDAARSTFIQTVQTGVGRRAELRLLLANGDIHHLESQFNVVCDEDGAVSSVIVLSRDITERRHNEEQLRAQAALLDQAHDAIIVCDVDDQIVYWNKGAETLYGWATTEAVGRNIHDLLHGTDRAAANDARDAVRKAGEWRGNLQQQDRQGNRVTVQSRWTFVRDTAGHPNSQLIINTDISDRRLHEEQFLRAQRRESLDTLAGGLARDLNNMLAPIVMASQLLRARDGDTEGLRRPGTQDASHERGANLLKKVRTFAHDEVGQRTEMSCHHLIKEVADILRQTLDGSIAIRTDPADELWPIAGNPAQLRQMLINLCVNARDAMPNGGTLSIAAVNTLLHADDPALSPAGRPGAHVQFTVTDTGHGIPPTALEHIFDPFFTTRENATARGLGLATVRSILDDHGGFATVESNSGQGTVFHAFLPAVTIPDSAPRPAPRQRPVSARGHGELILLVDDEAAFREISQARLEKAGYRVKTANDGADALTVFMRHRAEIKLVITDIMMPVMDGGALINSLQQIDAKVGYIAVSGLLQSEKAIVAEAAPDARVEFLPKPFTTDRLLQVVTNVLRLQRDMVE